MTRMYGMVAWVRRYAFATFLRFKQDGGYKGAMTQANIRDAY